jgi:hypothetical protein
MGCVQALKEGKNIMTYSGTYKIRGIFLDIGTATANTVTYYNPPRHHLFDEFEAYVREEKARQMFAWKEPKKRIPVPIIPVIRRYEKMFTGRNFPIGGSKK